MKKYGLEPDPNIRAIAPVIAHKLWGKSRAEDLTAAQRRQVREFAQSIMRALKDTQGDQDK